MESATFEQTVRNAARERVQDLLAPDGTVVQVRFQAHRLSQRQPVQRVSWNAHSGGGQELVIHLTRDVSTTRLGDRKHVHEFFTIDTPAAIAKRAEEHAVFNATWEIDFRRTRLIDVVTEIKTEFERKAKDFERFASRMKDEDASTLISRADEVVNDIRWFVPNLRTDLLIKYAQEIAAAQATLEALAHKEEVP